MESFGNIAEDVSEEQMKDKICSTKRMNEKDLDEAIKTERAPITLLIAQNAPLVTEPRYSPADMLAEYDTKDQYTDDSDTV